MSNGVPRFGVPGSMSASSAEHDAAWRTASTHYGVRRPVQKSRVMVYRVLMPSRSEAPTAHCLMVNPAESPEIFLKRITSAWRHDADWVLLFCLHVCRSRGAAAHLQLDSYILCCFSENASGRQDVSGDRTEGRICQTGHLTWIWRS